MEVHLMDSVPTAPKFTMSRPFNLFSYLDQPPIVGNCLVDLSQGTCIYKGLNLNASILYLGSFQCYIITQVHDMRGHCIMTPRSFPIKT